MQTFKNFEDFLGDYHSKDYMGTDDDMPDAYEAWLGELEVDHLIKLADIYGQEKYMEGLQKAKDIVVDAFRN